VLASPGAQMANPPGVILLGKRQFVTLTNATPPSA
jgi:hypothetical protein